MAYKIKWKRGGETAERYSNKKVAEYTLKKSNLSGEVVKTKLGDAGYTVPFTEFKYYPHGKKLNTKFKYYPHGKKRKWVKTPTEHGFVYRTHVEGR